jgi:hypothetical protein
MKSTEAWKKIKKPKGYEAPPMGPILNPMYGVKLFESDMEEKKLVNAEQMLEYIGNRIDVLQDTTDPISSMEMEDIIDSLKELKKIYERENGDFLEIIMEMRDFLKTFYSPKSTKVFIDDVPEPQPYIVSEYSIYPQRWKMRNHVRTIHATMMESTKRMKNHMDTGKFGDPGAVETILEEKAYLTLLIRKKIFRKEDIYGKVFKSEKDFTDLKRLFEKYKKARAAAGQ